MKRILGQEVYSKSFAPQRDEFAEYAAARQRIWLALRKAEALTPQKKNINLLRVARKNKSNKRIKIKGNKIIRQPGITSLKVSRIDRKLLILDRRSAIGRWIRLWESQKALDRHCLS